MNNEIKQVYFDNAATTPVSQVVLDNSLNILKDIYGNPSSLHNEGISAYTAVRKARENLACNLKVKPEELFFTSGGTESNNLAIQGVSKAYIRTGNHLITTKIEHPSVLESFKQLENEGFKVTYLSVDENGLVNTDLLNHSINENTSLISIMHVNNEIGTINNIKDLGKIIKSKNPNTIFHVDGVQSFGKINVPIISSQVDLFTASSHKIHGLKGCGLLYIKKGVKLKPIFFGGGQQNGIRPGTENTYGIINFDLVAGDAFLNIDINFEKVLQLKQRFLNNIKSLEDVFINGSVPESSPYILNISFAGIKGEVLLNALAQKGICVSTGSACNSQREKTSILNHLNLSNERVSGAIRISFSKYNTIEEVDHCVENIIEIVANLRKIKGAYK